MDLDDCHNYDDFRRLAKKKLPSPIFHYIDGGSDDEITLRRNSNSFNSCDLIPNVLNGVENPDLSTIVLGRKINIPLFLSPTAMQRLYHPDGDKASARAAENLELFIACQLWQTHLLRKSQIFQADLNYFNYMSTKTNQLLMICWIDVKWLTLMDCV